MANILKFPEKSSIQEEASQWLVRLDGRTLTEEEAEAFSVWLNSSLQHRDAIIELSRLWDNMDILSELSVLFPYDYMVEAKGILPRFERPAFLFSMAAVFLLAAISLILVPQQFYPAWLSNEASQPQELSYQTTIGERKDVVLEDGSIVNLNTDSLIVVSFTNKQRTIRLVKGEVYFEVAHEPSRPFFVHAGNGLIRVVGTTFLVRLKGQDMEIIVTEGKVEVASAISDKTTGIDDMSELILDKYLTTLGMGQTAEFGEKTINMVNTIEPEDVSRKLSWQHGMLEFKGETLDEVVREISRYTDKKIIISDASIRDIRIGGYFKTGEVEALLAVLKDGFPVTITRIDDNLVYLSHGNTVQTIIQ